MFFFLLEKYICTNKEKHEGLTGCHMFTSFAKFQHLLRHHDTSAQKQHACISCVVYCMYLLIYGWKAGHNCVKKKRKFNEGENHARDGKQADAKSYSGMG